MYDREMAQQALQCMSPENRATAEATARFRNMAACDVVLETALLVANEQSREGLYALRARQARPQLRAV